MTFIYFQGKRSDEDTNFRALSDKWQFRRHQKKWSRRKDRKRSSSGGSSKSFALQHHDTLFSSTEDILGDHTRCSGEVSDNHSPLMLVSELRTSPTGFDNSVKTYSFMLNEDRGSTPTINFSTPIIQVEGPAPEPSASKNLLQMASPCSSFESEEEEEKQRENAEDEELPPYLSRGSMDHFSSSILSTFESNMMKLTKTQSLPDVFHQSTTDYMVSELSDVSPYSSASSSTTSIVDSLECSSRQGTAHSVYPRPHPLADNRTYDPTSLSSNTAVETTGEWVEEEGRTVKRVLVPLSSNEEKKTTINKMNIERHFRMSSNDSNGTGSLAGSEYSERDTSSLSSPVPSFISTRLLNGYSGGEHSLHGEREYSRSSRGDSSPEITKRLVRSSVISIDTNKSV